MQYNQEVLEYYDLTPVDPGDNEYYKVLWKQYLRKLSKIDQPKDVLDAKLVHIRSTILEKEYNEKTGEEITTSAIQYNPLGPNYKNLFFEFANLELNDQAILKFVNKYGLLGSGIIQNNPYSEFESSRHSIVHGITDDLETDKSKNIVELINCWYWEIINMKSLINNWILYQEKKYNILLKKFKIYEVGKKKTWEFKDDNAIFKNNYGNFIIGFHSNGHNLFFKDKTEIKIKETDVHSYFKKYVLKVLEVFHRHRVRNFYDATDNWISGEIGPTGLIGALWHQAAKHIFQKETIKKCLYCHNPFIIRAGESRLSKKYCSNIHAAQYNRDKSFRKRIVAFFKKKQQIVEDGLGNFNYIIKDPLTNDRLAGIDVSYSPNFSPKSKRWHFMTMQLIGRMKRFSFNNAYLINSNLKIYFWDLKKGITGKRVKTPVDAVHLDPADKISLFEEDEVKKNINEVKPKIA
jgi:hypothetical protein|tara:strand:- start:666 stop:2051 length:1386 start_codon:yes stop_codon:yes gene_type:complete